MLAPPLASSSVADLNGSPVVVLSLSRRCPAATRVRPASGAPPQVPGNGYLVGTESFSRSEGSGGRASAYSRVRRGFEPGNLFTLSRPARGAQNLGAGLESEHGPPVVHVPILILNPTEILILILNPGPGIRGRKLEPDLESHPN